MIKMIAGLFTFIILGSAQHATAAYAYTYQPNTLEFNGSCIDVIFCEPFTISETPRAFSLIFQSELTASQSSLSTGLLGVSWGQGLSESSFGYLLLSMYITPSGTVASYNDFTIDNAGNIISWDVQFGDRLAIFSTTPTLDEYSLLPWKGISLGYGSTTNTSSWIKTKVDIDWNTLEIVAAVPEPFSSSMMIVGLAALGLVTRRRWL